MIHSPQDCSLRRGFNKLCSFAAALPRGKSHPTTCPRTHALGSVSASALPYRLDIDSDSEDDEVYADIMGKSNKFDYTNRPNSGAKLGAIIGRDLEKEADKAKKDADKQATKARKISSGSSTSCSSASGVSCSGAKDGIVHPLDIKIPSKQLGDDGTCAMADGLEIALRKGTSEASVLLEDLNLSNNGITTASLARLAPIITLARHDLKTLNLANNSIKVETTEEAEQWEIFLRAFSPCLKLRRLDLSGNLKLGARALEILARVHIQEQLVHAVPVSGKTSVQSLVGDFDLAEDQDTPRAATFNDAMTNGTLMKRRCGLRSIPYLTLTNIGLTDAGALWLSYVLEDHHYPSQLIDELNATHADTQIKTYQQSSGNNGIDWDQRESGLSKDGIHVLKKAEAMRQQTMLADQVSISSLQLEDGPPANNEGEFTGRRSTDRYGRSAPGDRRASIRSIRTNDGGEHELDELESARRKLQRLILSSERKAASAELWQVALRIAISSTTLSRLGPVPRDLSRFYTGPPMFDFTCRKTFKAQTSRPVTPINGKENRKTTADDVRASPLQKRRQGSYAATITANTGATAGEPELAITEVTNSPTTPKMIFKPHRKGAFSDGGDLLAQKLDALIVRDDNPQRFVRWQEEHMPKIRDGPNAFRNSRVPSHLPTKLMERVAGETVTKRERSILSDKQIQAAVAWGQNRGNFHVQKDWQKMADASQAWTLLEKIGCLAYQRE